MSDLPCWEIMQCSKSKECVVRLYPETPCWEVVEELGYIQSTLNVCGDCIVYVSKQKENILTREEMLAIMEKKGVKASVAACPLYS